MNADAPDGARKQSSPSPPLTSNDDELSLEPKNGSQSQLCQMTASSLPPSEANKKWNCEVCTYENFPLSRKCTMCRSAKPLLGEDIFRLQDSASALEAPQELGAEAVSERMKPMRISSPQAQPSGCAGTKWSCSRCTYENWPKTPKCAMCGTCTSVAGTPVSTDKARNLMGINDIASLHGIHNDLDNRRSKWKNNIDWVWLQACLGVVEGKVSHVEEYLSSGGDPARALTAPEVRLLDRASAFDAGYTLVHLAIRFQREDILTTLLSRISGGGSGLKRVPSYIAPDLAAAIRRHMASCIRLKKGAFPCRYISEFCTFSLPAEIEDLPAAIQEQLFSELLDREVQETLEAEPAFINWSLELTVRLGSRLYALWNRSAGDCLLDAIAQSAYGIFDGDGTLRRTLAATLHAAPFAFYERWAEAERHQAARAHYAPDDAQLRAEWARLLHAADTPAQPLHQLHIFALAHVMRRPIIVYGVNVVHSFRGEALGYARFQGVYLPLLWEQELCSKSPLCVGYTRGHFSALVPCAPCANTLPYICREQKEEDEEYVFLPLTDSEGKLLPVHFLNCDEMADSEGLLRRWVSARVTGGGVLAARQRLHARPLLVAQMLEEWLNHYRRLAQQTRGPFPPRLSATEYSSGPDTDDE